MYFARLTFPQLGWTGELPVAGVDLTGQQVGRTPPQSIVALLGRNLLQNWMLCLERTRRHVVNRDVSDQTTPEVDIESSGILRIPVRRDVRV